MSYYLTVFHPREELRQKVAGVEIEGKIRNTKKEKGKRKERKKKQKIGKGKKSKVN